MHKVREQIEETGDELAAQAVVSDDLGRLSPQTVAALRSSGVMRMLQPEEFGGFETHPVEFFEAVFSVGARSASAGWVTAVVGIHAWELGSANHRLQEEIWGADPDTWVASPYAPMGEARRTGGGWILTGRWSFSSGTDHCQWVVIGGWLLDDDGKPTGQRHLVLPRSDYTIVEDSWDVVGLKGTGSRDLIVDGAFVPDHRVIDPLRMRAVAAELGRDANPLYRLALPILFSGTITAGSLAAAHGALTCSIEWMRERVNARGARVASDSHQLTVLGEAASDIDSAKLQFLNDINRAWDTVAAGGELTTAFRLEARRNQVRTVRRAVEAVDKLYIHAGGGALRLQHPFQRFWRDTHAAMNHANNAAEPLYEAWSLNAFGLPVPDGIKF